MGMFDGIAGAIGGLASSALSFVGQNQTNQKSWDIAQSTNAASAEQAQAQRDWQTEMSNTAYQRQVKDLTAAGLNPMLSVTSGGGASTPSGAVGQVYQPTYRSPVQDSLGKGIQSASAMADIALKDSQTTESISRTGVNDETRKNLDADTMLKILEAPNVDQRLKNLMQEQLLNQARTTATSAEEAATRLTTKIRAAGDYPEAQSKGRYYDSAPYNPYALRDISQAGSSASSVLNSLKPYNFKFGK